eukprot:662515-Alexandrium_andersonii.AAC.1
MDVPALWVGVPAAAISMTVVEARQMVAAAPAPTAEPPIVASSALRERVFLICQIPDPPVLEFNALPKWGDSPALRY